ncbi:2OG-Fe(II) oxygenase [Pseudenhygromyxa sp. WMMC2535]|uniref:2OG-Fe(II) oxygenase n=1 Tax=Pseudenhygromyxa sp. WMMC2535 TaxID=2712867 RepID=UPI001553582B|nr:2OG-Fe(II) oxygenase [Pseudenhygromyxa sp. WMMC2535]NVB37746.1 2OG-Fe(II) oxygenase [Pseudenhygromyxa sp. WMMC2535]
MLVKPSEACDPWLVHDETHDIAEALLALDTPGTFALRLRVPAEDLHLYLRKLGPIEFPISRATASRMLALATRSPFGWGEHTITDPAVRSGWELRKSRVKIDGRRWNSVLREHLAEIREQLGLPDAGRLRASLDKLTIYGPGEFFVPHQDTEKDDEMIATLVVLLPSSFTGGALRCSRGDERVEFRRTKRGAEGLELIAFYSDCKHEIRPVKSGHRVALVYRLGLELDGAQALAPPGEGQAIEQLERAVAEHFERGEEKLVVLLDHEYTPRNLSWSRLKHGDRVRAASLREVADELDLDVHLALANMYEAWQCTPSLSSYYSNWSRWDEEDEEDEEQEDDDYTLEDMYDSSVTLRHWRSSSDAPADYDDLAVAESELSLTKANDAFEPVESNYEGYMGNYGDTLDRWYHRAAIVLWPRANAFLVEARLDPHAAIRQLIAQRRRGESDVRLNALVDIWPDCVGFELSKALVADVFRLAAMLEEPDIAAAFLLPVRPETMSAGVVGPLLEATRRHGLSWCESVLSEWYTGPRWGGGSSEWCARYPYAWLAKLIDADGEIGRKLAAFIVARQWDEAREKSVTPARERSPYAETATAASLAVFVDLLGASALAGAREIHDSIIEDLSSEDSRLTALELAAVVVDAHERIEGSCWRDWDTARLLHHTKRLLSAALAEPERGKEDWRIIVPRRCKSDDCTTLYEFLGSNEISKVWPLSKARRQSIHRVIDGAHLPVSHVTERKGRPYKLVLTKRVQLFTLDARRRERQAEALLRLKMIDVSSSR